MPRYLPTPLYADTDEIGADDSQDPKVRRDEIPHGAMDDARRLRGGVRAPLPVPDDDDNDDDVEEQSARRRREDEQKVDHVVVVV